MVKQKKRELGVTAFNTGNCDQTRFQFEPLSNHTLDKIGVKSVPITALNNEKSGFTVHLGATQDGRKAPPLIIFKGKKNEPAKLKLPEQYSVMVRSSPSSWINKNLLAEWLEHCWFPIMNSRPSLLILDNMKCDETNEVTGKAQELGITLMNLPPNTTAMSQPLDHNIIRRVKEGYLQRYENWRQKKEFDFKQKAHEWRNLSVTWVCEAWWDDIKPTTIKKAFRATLFNKTN